MRRRELSEHMKRGEELMQLNRAAFERNTEAFERNREAFERVIAALDRHEQTLDRHEQAHEENKLFLREMNRRNERVVQDLARGNREFLGKLGAELKEGRKESREGREEARAQTQALLALIDRLPPPAQAA